MTSSEKLPVASEVLSLAEVLELKADSADVLAHFGCTLVEQESKKSSWVIIIKNGSSWQAVVTTQKPELSENAHNSFIDYVQPEKLKISKGLRKKSETHILFDDERLPLLGFLDIVRLNADEQFSVKRLIGDNSLSNEDHPVFTTFATEKMTADATTVDVQPERKKYQISLEDALGSLAQLMFPEQPENGAPFMIMPIMLKGMLKSLCVVELRQSVDSRSDQQSVAPTKLIDLLFDLENALMIPKLEEEVQDSLIRAYLIRLWLLLRIFLRQIPDSTGTEPLAPTSWKELRERAAYLYTQLVPPPLPEEMHETPEQEVDGHDKEYSVFGYEYNLSDQCERLEIQGFKAKQVKVSFRTVPNMSPSRRLVIKQRYHNTYLSNEEKVTTERRLSPVANAVTDTGRILKFDHSSKYQTTAVETIEFIYLARENVTIDGYKSGFKVKPLQLFFSGEFETFDQQSAPKQTKIESISLTDVQDDASISVRNCPKISIATVNNASLEKLQVADCDSVELRGAADYLSAEGYFWIHSTGAVQTAVLKGSSSSHNRSFFRCDSVVTGLDASRCRLHVYLLNPLDIHDISVSECYGFMQLASVYMDEDVRQKLKASLAVEDIRLFNRQDLGVRVLDDIFTQLSVVAKPKKEIY